MISNIITNKIVLSIFVFVMLIIIVSPVMAAEWAVVNFASQQTAFPAWGRADFLNDLSSLDSVRANGENAAVDVIRSNVYIDVSVDSMSAVEIEAGGGKPDDPEIYQKDSIKIRFSNGRYFQLTRRGVYFGDNLILQTGPEFSTWKLTDKGTAAARFENANAAFTCFARGGAMLEIRNNQPLKLFSQPDIRRVREFLTTRQAGDNEILNSQLDSLLLEKQVLFVPADNTIWNLDKHSLTPEANYAKVMLVPCQSPEKWNTSVASASMPIIGKYGNGKWLFKANGATAAVEKKNKNDIPDLFNENWIWSDSTGPKTKWQFTSSYPLERSTQNSIRALKDRPSLEVFELKDRGKVQKRIMEFVDLSGRGIFLQGCLLTGGAIFSGHANGSGAMDLDDDGDGDVYINNVHDSGEAGVAEIGVGGFSFDFYDDRPGNFVVGARPAGLFEFEMSRGYVGHVGQYGWMFGKSLKPGLKYDGAVRGFEDQVLYRIKSGQQEMVKGPAIMYFKTTNDNIDRLGMGCFGGTDEDFINWNIQLDPLESPHEQAPSYRICRYEDPFGNVVRFTDSVYPQTWDGSKLPLTVQPSGSVDWSPFEAWYKVANEDYFELSGVRAIFAQEATMFRAAECMYSGQGHTGFRIEYGGPEVRPFELYYSDIFGGLHFKRARFGYQSYNAGHDMYRTDAIRPNVHRLDAVDMPDRFFASRDTDDIETVRYEGPMYLAYLDTDGDGYHDIYLYDAENNGIYERTLEYDIDSDTVTLKQGTRTAAWMYIDEPVSVAYLPGNYNKIEQLYLRGLDTLPLVIRTQLCDSGMPIERTIGRDGYKAIKGAMEKRPEFFVIAEYQWQTNIGLDLYHACDKYCGFEDMSETGFSSLCTNSSIAGLHSVEIIEPLTTDILGNLDILVLPASSRTLDQQQLLTTLEWVESGGTLFIVPTNEDEFARLALATIAEHLNVDINPDLIDASASPARYWICMDQYWTETAGIDMRKSPSPDQKIENFSSSDPDLLSGLDFLACVGYELQTSNNFKPLLSYKNKTVISQAPLGKGKIIISGINTFSNKYVAHPQHAQPFAQNEYLLRRLLRKAAGDESILEIKNIEPDGEFGRFTIKGKGGPVKLPRTTKHTKATVNGKPAQMHPEGLYQILNLPPGTSEVKITEDK
jgi:hypothetical protein